MTSAHVFVALNHEAYYPGKPVDGYVVFLVINPITVRTIKVHLKGVEMVSWYQGVTQTEHCHGYTEIFEEDLVLSNFDQDFVLEPGTYTYPFEWILPENVAASYEEAKPVRESLFQNYSIPENGFVPKSFGEEKSYIRYTCSACIDTVIDTVNGTETDEIDEKIFRFEKSLYFKVVEAFNPAILVQKARRIDLKKSFLFAGDPVEVRVAVANGGVIFTGQNLFLHAFVHNASSRRVERINMRLDEHIAFTAPDPTGVEQIFHRKETVLNATVQNSIVRTNETFEQDLMLNVPTIITGTLKFAKHISREYYLVVDVEMSINGKVTVTLPVLLLQWTPLIKDDVPDVVPVKISKRIRSGATITDENTPITDEITPKTVEPDQIQESLFSSNSSDLVEPIKETKEDSSSIEISD